MTWESSLEPSLTLLWMFPPSCPGRGAPRGCTHRDNLATDSHWLMPRVVEKRPGWKDRKDVEYGARPDLNRTRALVSVEASRHDVILSALFVLGLILTTRDQGLRKPAAFSVPCTEAKKLLDSNTHPCLNPDLHIHTDIHYGDCTKRASH